MVGRYLLTPAIFDILEATSRGARRDQLTDGIARLMGQESVYALPFSGRRYDCGKLTTSRRPSRYALSPALRDPLLAHCATCAERPASVEAPRQP